MNPFAEAIIGIIVFTIGDIIMIEFMQKRDAKKSGYNCETCKNWKCWVKYCEKKRKEH